MNRIESLDYLRGLMALAVMSYHYVTWATGALHSDSILGRLGIYAVSTFYILSGLSLSVVYHGHINDLKSVARFWIKRLFRIFPLFWLTITAFLALRLAVALKNGTSFDPPLDDVVLSYTLLFGFVEPTAYLTPGAWSIGNEMVFYATLPPLLLASFFWRYALEVSGVAAFIVGVVFAYAIIDSNSTLGDQWHFYISPLNQIFLFLGGVLIGKYFWPGSFQLSGLSLCALGSFLFCLWPVYGDKITLVTDTYRLFFSATCFAVVTGAYLWNPKLHNAFASVLAFFGRGCYSIYLLHPLVSNVTVQIARQLSIGDIIGYYVAVPATLAVSWATYRYLEQPFVDIGKRLSFKLKPGHKSLTTQE